MKGPPDRTKVVLRHLPPSIPHSMIMEQIDKVFGGRYSWSRFRPWKTSHKHPTHLRLYVDFKRGEDVFEFAEFFNGHVFVNEKGNQFKVQVEYAPSQRVPKQWTKKDGREGTIVKDPEYLEFLENLSKPVENLPSAEIQLERRESDRVGLPKDAPIVTPLMDYIRQKRAAKIRPQKPIPTAKVSRRSGASTGVSISTSSRRAPDKKRGSTMYVQMDAAKNSKGNDKSSIILVTKKDDQRSLEKSSSPAHAAVKASEEGCGGSGANEIGTKKIIILKGKEKGIEVAGVAINSPSHQSTTTAVRNASNSYSGKYNQRRDSGSGRIIRTILSSSGTRPVQPSSVQSQQGMQSSFVDKDKRPYQGSNAPLTSKDANGGLEEKVSGSNEYGHSSEKFEKRTRNRDRADRGVWAPLHRSDGSHASSESLSSTTQYTFEGGHDQNEIDMLMTRNGMKNTGSGTNSHSSYNNGSQKQYVRRALTHGARENEGNHHTSESKPSKQVPAGYSPHEKQVWVQKSGSGT